MSGDETISGAQIARKRRQYVIGLLLLLIVVLEWTGSNFLTQDLFEDGYNKPFFVTYMNTASFSLYLVPALIKRILWEGDTAKREPTRQGYQALIDDDETRVDDECSPGLASNDSVVHAPLTVSETAKLASIFCVFWFAANWTVNASLSFTSVASTTILSSMSGFFTLLIGRLFRVEALNLSKLGAVAVSFAGSVLVSLADNTGTPGKPGLEIPDFSSGNSHPQALFGDFLALGSALFYALYVVLLKVRIGDESRINMQLFFGFVGIFNILGFWPMGVLLHYTKIEVFEPPSSKKALYAVLLNMFITLSSDFIYVLAMLKTTPLVVTVGLSLTIPLAVGGDLLLGTSTSAQALIGAALVLVAFVVIGLEDREEAPGVDRSLHIDAERGRSGDRLDGLRQVPLRNQSEDDESLRKSVEAIFASRREQARRARRESGRAEPGGTRAAGNQESADRRPNPLERGRSRTRSGTFRRERVSGSLRRSEERRTRSRTGRKSSSERDDTSRRDFRTQGWEYDQAVLSDSEENTAV
ncbi:hypothetical protein B0J17DRAFT_655521 [Rhizoctonia solani]|nr:hypothetical protein B0J17DRAFT_655521 [Rhizoctonia solani]